MKGFGVCAWSVPLEGEELFQWLKENGVQNVSVDFNYDVCKEESGMHEWCASYRSLAEKYGIEISIMAMNVLCKYGMCHKENEEIIRDILKVAFRAAKELGAGAMHLPSFVDGEIHSREELDQTIVCLKTAAALGEEFDFPVGYESPLPAEDVKYVLSQVSGKTFFLLFDNENVSLRGIEPENLYRSTPEMYLHTHLKAGSSKDASLRPLEEEAAVGGLKPLIAAMKEHGFDGWVISESSYKKEADRAVWEEVFRKDRDFVMAQFA